MTFESQMAQDARIDVGAILRAILKRLPRIAIVTVALLAAAFVIVMFMPRLYESSASILVEPRSNIYFRSTNEQAPTSSAGDAGVVSSQIELIKSRDTLLGVVDRLDLRSVPEFNGAGGEGFSPLAIVSQLLGRRAAQVSIDELVLNALYERLSVTQERDSRLISVTVSSTSPQLAADIANAVAAAHVARRNQLSLSDTAEASGWLADEIAKLRVTVTAAETAVANFKVANDLFLGSNNTSLADQQLSTVAAQVTAAQERKNTALSRAALIRGLIEQGQPIDGVADVRDSVIIQQLSQEKARLQGEKAQRSATLLSNHPTIQALTAQIAELNNQIALEGRRVADALEAEARVQADLEASLQADMVRAKSSASTATQDIVTLDGLEREAKAQRDLLESYLLRYSEAMSRTESNSALPDVRVVSEAAPSVSPASPKTQLILVAVAIVAVMVQLGIIIFGELMSGRALVPVEGRVPPQDELDEAPFVEAELEPDQRWEYPPEPDPADPEMPQDALVAVAPEPEIEPAMSLPPEPEQEPAAATLPDVLAFSALSTDLVLGRTHLLILAAHRDNADCEALAEELVADALGRGLSIALIDAGSARRGDEPGLADLSTGTARFGDVVQKSADNSFAEVAWGQGRIIDRESTKPLTLVEALGDIYEVVVLMTGRVGGASTLPMFQGLDGRLVLVAGDEDDLAAVARTRENLLDAGFERCEVATARARVAA
ncbi:GumC family protein [Devosia ginsengisoli]|uniref:GumC family protein n=1 Tax=Devosia ginsengisoli TaxID=400770 RepID=UPI0026EB40D9|nr:Wzz/FepE/Etk N-terminal domain-containing protein [Devosia ginsengisoli]MCR6672911.1 Wzz/FepE/Etk N-terminal domain-containing protein [Devosia ginsengisoli]